MSLTMKDIACALDVSVSTVSRVLNNVDEGRVSRQLREKILRHADSHKFEFNYAARALKKKTPNSIALVSAYHPYLLTSYTSEVLRGVIDSANENNFNLMFDVIPESLSFMERFNYLSGSGIVNGVLVQGAALEGENTNGLSTAKRFPLVVINSRVQEKTFPYVDCENYNGAFTATEHLIELGHRKILHLAGKSASTNSKERIMGYTDAMKKHSLYEKNLIFGADYIQGKAFKVITELIDRGWPDFDAIFASSDSMAVGAVKALEKKGVKVPQDLSVIGFDDIPISSYMRPPLSTIKQDMYEIGNKAAAMLFSMITGEEKSPQSQKIPVELIERESTLKKEPA